ncbi:MAG: sigma-54 dependent transcriptional regulator [Candidatus Hydrogenedentota bacterium]
MNAKILIAEDDATQREIIEDILSQDGHEVDAVESAPAALEAVEADFYHILLTDLRMPGMDGLELLRRVKGVQPDVEVIVMTAYASVSTAVTAMKEGATDYLAKPFDKEQLLVVVNKTLDRMELRQENRQLRELVTQASSLGNIIGESESMQAVFRIAQRAVPIDSTVLITGESGTGKELVARYIHFAGPRKEEPFIVVNCAAIPDTLVESELFGHEKGAFTGAEASRQGKFEVANSGTIFLDEIGDMRMESQAKLLRVVQDGVVERIGATQSRQVDVRVIAATNQNLREKVAEGVFREDLYFRLEVLPIRMPPLRERARDLPLLIAHFREKLSQRLGRPAPGFSPDAVAAMRAYAWPGNVRELENTLEQLFILSDSETITADDLPAKLQEQAHGASGGFSLPPDGVVLEDLEYEFIRQALDRSGGQIKEAAELLGISYKTLQYRLKKHDISRKSTDMDT